MRRRGSATLRPGRRSLNGSASPRSPPPHTRCGSPRLIACSRGCTPTTTRCCPRPPRCLPRPGPNLHHARHRLLGLSRQPAQPPRPAKRPAPATPHPLSRPSGVNPTPGDLPLLHSLIRRAPATASCGSNAKPPDGTTRSWPVSSRGHECESVRPPATRTLPGPGQKGTITRSATAQPCACKSQQ